MSLKALTFSAIEKLKVALGDLAIDVVLRKRTQNSYTPGQPVTYSTVDHNIKAVITKYRYDEIDGTMIKAEDVLIIVFPPISGAVPLQNDLIVNGSVDYRIMANNPMYAGDEIAFNQIQGRPLNG